MDRSTKIWSDGKARTGRRQLRRPLTWSLGCMAGDDDDLNAAGELIPGIELVSTGHVCPALIQA